MSGYTNTALLEERIGGICPICQRRQVGYISKRGQMGIYCVAHIGSYPSRDNPREMIERVRLSFPSHQRLDQKDGFWADASKVIWGDQGKPEPQPRQERQRNDREESFRHHDPRGEELPLPKSDDDIPDELPF